MLRLHFPAPRGSYWYWCLLWVMLRQLQSSWLSRFQQDPQSEILRPWTHQKQHESPCLHRCQLADPGYPHQLGIYHRFDVVQLKWWRLHVISTNCYSSVWKQSSWSCFLYPGKLPAPQHSLLFLHAGHRLQSSHSSLLWYWSCCFSLQ